MHRLRWKLYSRAQVSTSGPKRWKPGSYIGKALNYSAMRLSIRLKKELSGVFISKTKNRSSINIIIRSKSQLVNLNEMISILKDKIKTLKLCSHYFFTKFNCVSSSFRKTLINYCQKTRGVARLAYSSDDLLLYHWHFILWEHQALSGWCLVPKNQ